MQTILALDAMAHSKLNRGEIEKSRRCGCFYCERIFPPVAIVAWTDRDRHGARTALCPYCALDAVIGDASGFEISPELLRRMREIRYDDSSPTGPAAGAPATGGPAASLFKAIGRLKLRSA